MDWKIFGTAFLTLFLAELGDKTQLAVITMTASTESKISVFLGASLALITVTLLGVMFGGVLSQYVPTEWAWGFFTGGAAVLGSWVATHSQRHIPEKFLRAVLGLSNGIVGLLYVLGYFGVTPVKI